MTNILYPDEHPQVHRHSSIDQFNGFLSKWVKGGPAPIVFDMIDGITCDEIKSHPVIIDLSGKSLGYVYPEAHCNYASDKFIYFDRESTEQVPLPECMGGQGEFYERFLKSNSFVNFDNSTSLGSHSNYHTRTGLSFVTAEESLPPVE